MARTAWFGGCAVLATLLAGWGSTSRADESRERVGQAEVSILAALRSPTSFDFVDTPLTDAIDYLREYHHIEIVFDLKALEEPSITPSDTTVTLSLKDISLRSGLKFLLHRIDDTLTFVIKDEVLLITTRPAALQMVDTRVYHLSDAELAPLAAAAIEWRHKAEFAQAPAPLLMARGDRLIVSASLPDHEIVRTVLAALTPPAAAGDHEPTVERTPRAAARREERPTRRDVAPAHDAEGDDPFGQ